MADFGGFEHNLHGLRIIGFLEYRYASLSPGSISPGRCWRPKPDIANGPTPPKFSPTWKRANPYWKHELVDAADSLAWKRPTSTTRCRWA